jgi:hypothetical protein
MFRFELRRRQVPQTGVRPDLVVVPAPGLDADCGVGTMPEPFEREALVAERPVERFIGAVPQQGLPGSISAVSNLRGLERPEDRARHKLGPIVGAQEPGGPVDAHQLCEHLDHAPRTNPTGHVNRVALARELVDDGQTLQRPPRHD